MILKILVALGVVGLVFLAAIGLFICIKALPIAFAGVKRNLDRDRQPKFRR